MAAKVLQTNLDVDYVISYRVKGQDKDKAGQQYQKLIRSLNWAGLETEVRNGDGSSLLIFVKAKDENAFNNAVYRSRMKDWLHGIRQIQPVRDAASTLTAEPMTPAERLHQVYQMITSLPEDGGAGITPQSGEWKSVEAIFPLHDHVKNKEWLKQFSTKTFLSPEDLDHIKDAMGEKVGYYYAFLQSYFTFMIFPAIFGFSCWLIVGSFSSIYAIVNTLWCVIFVEYWKRQETELAVRWGVKNVSSIEDKRREFKPDKVFTDKITGEKIAIFPVQKRMQRQLLQIPLAVASIFILSVVICTCYAIEIFISEVYSGPFQSVLVFTPTVILTLAIPTISNFLTKYATEVTDYENYETQGAHDRAMVSKVFVINFITSYLALFLTSFVYVPFASILVPYLDVFSLTVRPFAENEKQLQTPTPAAFNINPNRLKNQMIYFAVTAQIVSFFLETVVPLVTQKGSKKYQQLKTSHDSKNQGASSTVSDNDPADEKEFLARVREEAALGEYDVTADLREMAIQFGYLSLFSVIWPFTPVSYFINNWIELRGDMFKMTVESRRPNPVRADTIGPWLDSLEALAWLGSVTSAALVYMFSDGGLGPDGRPTNIKLWALFLSIFLSEHIYLVVRLVVRHIINKLDSSNMRKERSERFMVRKKFLEEAGLGDAVKPLVNLQDSPLNTQPGGEEMVLRQTFTKETLEEDARKETLRDSTPATRFWARQRGPAETEKIGLKLMEFMDVDDSKEKKVK